MNKKQGVKKIINEKFDLESKKMDEVIGSINQAIPLLIADFEKPLDNVEGKLKMVQLNSIKLLHNDIMVTPEKRDILEIVIMFH